MGCVLNLNCWRIFLVNIEYSPLAAWCDLVTYCSHPDEIPVVMDTIRSVCCYKICIKIKPLVVKEPSLMIHTICHDETKAKYNIKTGLLNYDCYF